MFDNSSGVGLEGGTHLKVTSFLRGQGHPLLDKSICYPIKIFFVHSGARITLIKCMASKLEKCYEHL